MSDSPLHSDALLRDWQEQTSRRLLGLMAGAATLMTVAFASSLNVTGFVGSVLMSSFLALVAVWRKAPHFARVSVIILVFGYSGFFPLLGGHDTGSAVLALMAGLVFAVLLANWKVAAGFMAYSVGLLLTGAWMEVRGLVLFPEIEALPAEGLMISSALLLVAYGSLMVAAVALLVERLRLAMVKQAQVAASLERESAERAAALVKLEEAQARLVSAGKMELLSQLAGGIAHDMNNALTVVLGEAGLLYDEAPEAAEAITEAVEHASSLTRQLLAMGRREVVRPRTLDLGGLVERIAGMLRRTLPADVELQLELEPNVGIEADPNQLKQIILNLGTNAAHAMADGGTLGLHVSAKGSRACLEVSDTGVGMDEDTLARVFEPFFTTKPVGVGTGLGLASVKAIVESLRGELRCTSEPGVGTRFTIELPRLDDDKQWSDTLEPSASQVGVRFDGRRVLVVDDEVRVRAVVTATLKEAGAQVTDAGNAHAAITLAEQADAPFELLWTDVVMPQGGGGMLVEWFAEHSPTTKIVVCTGYSDDELLRRDIALGHYELVNKPFGRDEVLAYCERALRAPSRHAIARASSPA